MTKYIRYQSTSGISYGILEGDTIRELQGDLFAGGGPQETKITRPLSSVKLLAPCAPRNVLAVGRNYQSHLGSRPVPSSPSIFLKPVASLQDPEGPIVIPPDAADVHYEGELVLVIGRQIRRASLEEARAAIFGVTCGNDVSEREWQRGPNKDLQWWRAKGSDTFAPLGPYLVTGLDYGKLMIETRLNGQVVQKQSTADMLFDCPTVVSYISRWITLEPGDVVYTGTPGETRKMNPGDTVEVELEGVGVLRNPVVASS